jgi:mannosyltransferase
VKVVGKSPRTQAGHYVGLTLIVMLAFCVRVYRLDHQSMWWDEIHTGAGAMAPLRTVFDNLFTIRNHVPLYFLLVRAWAWMGHTDFTLRLFSVVWGVASVPLMYRVGALIGGAGVGRLSALLLAVSPFHIWYSQEARMYTLVCASTLVAGWLLLRWLQTRSTRDLAGYGAFMLVALYTHYLSLLVLVAHYVFFSLHYRRLKRLFGRWLLCAGIVAGLFGVWMALMLVKGGFAESPIGWIAPSRWYEPALTLLTFASGPTTDLREPWGYVATVLSLSAIGTCIASISRRAPGGEDVASTFRAGHHAARHALTVRFLLCWLLVPLLLAWAISLDLPIPQKRSIYMDRYLIHSLPPFAVLVAWGVVLASRQRAWVAAGAAAVLAAAVLPSLLNLYWNPAYARNDWRGALAYVEAAWEEGDVLLLRPSDTLPVAYYMDGAVAYEVLPFLFSAEEREAYLAGEMEPTIEQIARERERAWLVTVEENTDPHGFPYARNAALSEVSTRDAIKAWLDERYACDDERGFAGLWLARYELLSVVSARKSRL